MESSIAFKMTVSDFSEMEGLLHYSQKGLNIEFIHSDSIFKVFRSSVKSVTLTLDRISHLEHKKGWFADQLIIQAKTIKDCQGIPGTKAGKLTLKVKKKTRRVVENILVDLNLRISQNRLDEIERGQDARLDEGLAE